MTCEQQKPNMATRMNIMKLVQEMQGFAQMNDPHLPVRTPNPVLLNLFAAGRPRLPFRRRQIIQILIQDQPDIPAPVPITHIRSASRSR
jgi:hypothetical protein